MWTDSARAKSHQPRKIRCAFVIDGKRCNNVFVGRNYRAMYCPDCQPLYQREKARESYHRNAAERSRKGAERQRRQRALEREAQKKAGMVTGNDGCWIITHDPSDAPLGRGPYKSDELQYMLSYKTVTLGTVLKHKDGYVMEVVANKRGYELRMIENVS